MCTKNGYSLTFEITNLDGYLFPMTQSHKNSLGTSSFINHNLLLLCCLNRLLYRLFTTRRPKNGGSGPTAVQKFKHINLSSHAIPEQKKAQS